MCEVRVDAAGVHRTAFADELEDGLRFFLARRRPPDLRHTRVHQLMVSARQESIVDEEILLDAKLRIAPFEIARTVIDHAVPQRQVLRASGGADRVGLHEAEFVDRASEGGRLEQGASNGITTQMVERDPHELRLWVARFGGGSGSRAA